MFERLDTLIRQELASPAPEAMLAIAEELRAIHGDNAVAVLGYGSCLRDGVSPDKISDLYVILDSTAKMPGGRLLRLGARLVPPNVYYLEVPHNGETLRAKCAAVTLSGFERWTSEATDNPYFWARFAQPVALLHTADEAISTRITGLIRQSMQTLITHTLPLMPAEFSARDLWVRALEQTYRTEWRSEGAGRASEVIGADLARYERITPPLLAGLSPEASLAPDGIIRLSPDAAKAARCYRAWARRRLMGRVWATLRLFKAAFTFQGGLDYLLWKIARHSGVEVTPTAFQRRHPILGAPSLFWKIYRRGGFR